jgi:Baseplate J-like protein
MTSSAEFKDLLTGFYAAGLLRLGVDPVEARQAVLPGTDVELRWRTVAFALMKADAYTRSRDDATMLDTAQGDDLLALALIEGVEPSPGSGATGSVVVVVSGITVIPADAELTSDTSGLRYKTTSITVCNPAVPASLSVAVVGVDVGVATNLDPGAKLTWSAPPVALQPGCEVGAGGLTGGIDTEGIESVRQRALDKRRDPGFGGNSAHVLELLGKASLAVRTPAVYPGLQGPNTCHAAIAIEGTAKNGWSRIADAGLLQSTGNYVVSELSESNLNFTLTSVAHQPLDLDLSLALPLPLASGAAQGGWLDAAPSPAAPCQVTATTSTTRLRVGTAVAPVALKQISIWRSASLDFKRTQIAAVTALGGGLYDLDLVVPVAGVSVGDLVSPTAAQQEAYATNLLEAVRALAPGQKSAAAQVLERSRRRPLAAVSAVTTQLTTGLQTAFAEVASASFLLVNGVAPALPLEPAVPGSVASPPFVHKLRHLGFYPAA